MRGATGAGKIFGMSPAPSPKGGSSLDIVIADLVGVESEDVEMEMFLDLLVHYHSHAIVDGQYCPCTWQMLRDLGETDQVQGLLADSGSEMFDLIMAHGLNLGYDEWDANSCTDGQVE